MPCNLYIRFDLAQNTESPSPTPRVLFIYEGNYCLLCFAFAAGGYSIFIHMTMNPAHVMLILQIFIVVIIAFTLEKGVGSPGRNA